MVGTTTMESDMRAKDLFYKQNSNIKSHVAILAILSIMKSSILTEVASYIYNTIR